MSKTEQYYAGIGLTYGVQKLLPVLIASAYDRKTKLWDEIDALREMQRHLKAKSCYHPLSSGFRLDETAMSTITIVDQILLLFENYDDSLGTYKLAEVQKCTSQMKNDMKRLGMWPYEGAALSGDGNVQWTWDNHRRGWYYWSAKENVFIYSGGLWVRRDGTETNEAEVVALRSIPAGQYAPPPPPPPGRLAIESGRSTDEQPDEQPD